MKIRKRQGRPRVKPTTPKPQRAKNETPKTQRFAPAARATPPSDPEDEVLSDE